MYIYYTRFFAHSCIIKSAKPIISSIDQSFFLYAISPSSLSYQSGMMPI